MLLYSNAQPLASGYELFIAQSPRSRTSLLISQSAAFSSAGCSGERPDSASDTMLIAVSQTGPTGLNAKIIGIIDKQSRKIFFRLGVNRICSGITEHAQSNQAVQHRGINRCEAVTALTDPLKHPP